MDSEIEELLLEVRRLQGVEKTARKYAAKAEAACRREGLLRDEVEVKVSGMVANENKLFEELEGLKGMVKEGESEVRMLQQKLQEVNQKHEWELTELKGNLIVQLAEAEQQATKSLEAEIASLERKLREAEKSNKAGEILIDQLSRRLSESGVEASHLKDVNTELVHTLNDDDSLRKAHEKIEALEERCLQASKTIAGLQLENDEAELMRKRLAVLQQHTDALSSNPPAMHDAQQRSVSPLLQELEEVRAERDTLAMLVSESDFMMKSRSELVQQLWKFYHDVKNTCNTLQALQASTEVRGQPSNGHIKKQLLYSLECIQAAKGKGRWIVSNYLTEVEKLHLGVPTSMFQPDDKVINCLGLEPNRKLDLELKRQGGYDFVKNNMEELVIEARRRGFPIEEFSDILPPATSFSPGRCQASEWNRAVDSPPRPHIQSLSPKIRKAVPSKDSLTYASDPPSPSHRRRPEEEPDLISQLQARPEDLLSRLRSASASKW